MEVRWYLQNCRNFKREVFLVREVNQSMKVEEHIYISTNATGLYEKYGYRFYRMMKDIENEDSRVYIMDIV